MNRFHHPTNVIRHHVELTLNVTMVHAFVCQNIKEIPIPDVAPNVSSTQTVQETKLVLIENVWILVQAHVVIMPFATLSIIYQCVVVHPDWKAMPSFIVYHKKVMFFD